MTDYVKTQYVEAPDVEKTKRGFLDVHIKQEYNGSSFEYDTTFLSSNVTKKLNGEIEELNSFGDNSINTGDQ